MKRILNFLIHKARTLQISVLTLFLSLFIVAFLAVALFTNSALIKSTENLSSGIISRASDRIVEKFQNLAASAEETVILGAYLYKDMGEISFENKQLMALSLNFVKTNNEMTSYLIAQENGDFLAVINLSKSSIKTFQGDPEKSLPPDAVYSIRSIEKSNDVYYYLDSNFEVIASESLLPTDFDPRQSDWYREAKNNKGLTWSDFYTLPTGETAITVADPVMNAQGEVIAVIGADLTLGLLSRFLAETKIGKTGKAFIVDDSGEVIFPHLEHLNQSLYTPSQIATVFEHFSKQSEHADFLFAYKGRDYLAHVNRMPSITQWYTISASTHWNLVILVPFDEYFHEIKQMWKKVFWIVLSILILSGIIVIYFSKRISSPIVVLSKEIDKLRHLKLDQEIRIKSNVKEIILMDASVSAMRHAIRSISRYLPKEIVRALFQKGEDIVLGGEKKEITIFFSDIENFTAVAETQPIDFLLPLLAEYFNFVSKTILDSGGTIDKYMGDGIMAFWGAPLSMPDHAAKAAYATLRCNKDVALLNQKRRAEGKPEFRTRFGINSGTVIVGNIGMDERMNYTIIGDAVNTTFRLQDIDKIYHTEMIMSEEVRKRIGENFVYRPLDEVVVKGKTEKTKIYQLLGLRAGEADLLATPEEIALCQDFAQAYEAFQRNDHALAKTLFSALAQKFPNDYPTTIYLKRLT